MKGQKATRRLILFILTLLILVCNILSTGGYSSCITNVILAMQEAPGGCKNCHAEVSETLPKGHVTVVGTGVKHCLTCHVANGAATGFEWLVHFKHYSDMEFLEDCWSCHQIDAVKRFRLIGIEDGKEIKATKNVVEKMGHYFRSWGTSEHLDHRHAQSKVTCGHCHGTFFPEKGVSMEQCLMCHGSYTQLAQKASIHADAMSPHFTDKELECSDCHRVHENSMLVCSQCH